MWGMSEMDAVRSTIAMVVILNTAGVQALTWHTGRLVVSLADKSGNPITNAVVSVKTLNKCYIGVGRHESDFDVTRRQSDTNGVADVTFRFWDPDFIWWVETPSHYSAFSGAKRECFDATIVPSDYVKFATNTVEGLRRFNELKALEEEGDLEGYYAKFEPKSVTYSSNVIYRAVSFYPKVRPSAMFMYDFSRYLPLPRSSTSLPSNGVEIVSYPVAEYDLRKGAILPPHADPDDVEDGIAGETADFSVTRFVVETNGVRTVFGSMDFAPGCGAYRCGVTGDNSFPSLYEADTNAVYEAHVPFELSLSVVSNRYVVYRPLLREDEYMVLRTRAMTNSAGTVTSCHYSKIVGGILLHERDMLVLESSVFNPRPNDPNLEADIHENLADGPGAETRWP